MLITGLSLTEYKEILASVSRQYDGNLAIRDYSELSGNRFRVSVRAVSSHGRGARRSWAGRRSVAACWHAHRDILIALFTAFPAARVQTALATYKGADGFRELYPDTAFQNIGSQMQPVTMPELCECGGNEPATNREHNEEFAALAYGWDSGDWADAARNPEFVP